MKSSPLLPARPVHLPSHRFSRRAILLGLALTVLGVARADDWAPNLTTAATWESNATNADVVADQIDSLRLNGDLIASQNYPCGRDDALQLGLHAAAEWWPRYNGLTTGAAGGRIGWRHQFGADVRAPLLLIEGFADATAAKDTGRRGVLAGGILSVRKRFGDFTRATLSHEVAWYDARYSVYDRGSSETGLEVERDLNPTTRLSFAARFRDGDIVSYAAGDRPDLAGLASYRAETDIFGRALVAHRIDAHTWSGRAAFVRALDQNSAIVVAYEWRNHRRDSFKATNNLISVSFVYQF